MNHSFRCLFAAVGITGVLAITAPVFAQVHNQPGNAKAKTPVSTQPQLTRAPGQLISTEPKAERQQVITAEINPVSPTTAAAAAAADEATRVPMMSRIFPCPSMQQ
jgi:hypothetical protein